jgi:hypothetical protein
MQTHNRKGLLPAQRRRATAGLAFGFALAALALVLLVACGGRDAPAVRLVSTPNVTNFTGVYADNTIQAGDDLIAGDDLTITDDATLGDDVSVGGNVSLVDGVWNGIIEGNVIFGDDSDAIIMWETDAVNGDALLLYATAGHIRAGTVYSMALEIDTGNLAVGNGTPSTTLDGEDAYIEGTLEVDGALNFDGNADIAGTLTVGGVTTVPTDTEHIGLYTVDAAAVITTTDGALWTVGATEVWYIERVICHVTTNFDCDGDDCTIEIGLTGGDIDGFLDLDDGELQAADAEIAGLPAGWQGFGGTDTRGAFFAAGGGVIMTNDTIDIKIEDNSTSNDPTAGAATCYVVYLRVQ